MLHWASSQIPKGTGWKTCVVDQSAAGLLHVNCHSCQRFNKTILDDFTDSPCLSSTGWHIINKPADCQPRKKNSWQLNVCVDGEIGNNCWGEEGGERPGIDVLDANAFECVIKSSDMVVICKADQLPTTRTLDEKKERKKGKKGKEISFLILDKSLAVSV